MVLKVSGLKSEWILKVRWS